MIFRRAAKADYPTLAAIAALSTRDNPDAIARGRGFLAYRFDETKFAAFNRDLEVLVADEGGQAVGFVCAVTRSFAEHTPILQAMFAAGHGAFLDGQPLDALRLFCYGPVCITPEWQERGLLRGMLSDLKCELKGRFDAGVLFVDAENPHSLQAHELGLGMTRIGTFEFEQRHYWALAFRCSE